MLIIFAISITPRIALHALFASHKDAAGPKLSHVAQQQFSKTVFNCNCDNIVAESPFTEPGNVFELYTFQPFSPQQKIHICSFYSPEYFLFTLRGPPAQS
jgi:hypothetical protein